jgi:hypothetical protein
MSNAGINIGYGHTKIRTMQGYQSFPSIAHPANTQFTGLGMERQSRIVRYNGMDYEVGQDAKFLSRQLSAGKVLRPRWLDTVQYKVFQQAVWDILHESSEGSGKKPWTIVTGVAVEHSKDQDYLDRLQFTWIGEHQTSKGESIVIETCRAVPEPMGAYWAMVLSDPQLKERVKNRTVIVVDLGYYTIDWIGIHGNRLIPALSSGDNLGMHTLYAEFQKYIQGTYSLSMDLVDIENRIRDPHATIRIGGKDVSLEHVLSPVLEQVLPAVVNRFLEGIGSVSREDALYLVTGGGAKFLYPYLREYLDHAELYITPDPQRDNADGYYMLATALSQKGVVVP